MPSNAVGVFDGTFMRGEKPKGWQQADSGHDGIVKTERIRYNRESKKARAEPARALFMENGGGFR